MSDGLSDGELSPRHERTQRLADLRAWIEGFHRRRGDDDLVWITTPGLIARSKVVYEERSRGRRLAPKRARAVLDKHRLNADSRWDLFDGVLFLASTDNQQRAQRPIARRLGDQHPPSSPVRVSDSRIDDLGDRAIALADELLDAAQRASLMVHEKRRVYLQLVGAAANLAWFETLIETTEPRAVVIGSTHSIPARALALAARRAGVPSVYVPHAPVIADARLVDLPVDFAALRGPREVDYYQGFGADRAGIEAIGNPAVEAPPSMPDLRPGTAPVFALPHYDEGTFEPVVAMVREALGDKVIASPHPRGNREFLRSKLPSGWELWEGRTFDLFRRGAQAVIQFSSGAALESLQLGIPTIELTFAGEEPNYPFLRHRGVPVVSTASELRRAIKDASPATVAEREELRAWAQGWVSADGQAAAQAGAALIRRAASEGPRERPVWDAWRPAPGGRLGRLLRRAVRAADA